MSNIVGTKGQFVIPKEIREQLGIKPGWRAVSRIVDGQVVTTFIPPRHRRSLKGILAQYVREPLREDEDWHEIRERAWAQAWRERSEQPEGEAEQEAEPEAPEKLDSELVSGNPE